MKNTRTSIKRDYSMVLKVSYNVLISIIALSCGQNQNNKILDSHSETNKIIENIYSDESSCIQDRIECVVVEYWAHDAFVYIIHYSRDGLEITRTIDKTITISSDKKHISDDDINDRFTNYIDALFITGSERIEYSRSKSSDPCITDYPMLNFLIKYDGDKSISKAIQIGDEQYDIIYNPFFLEFYDFLDELVRLLDQNTNDVCYTMKH